MINQADIENLISHNSADQNFTKCEDLISRDAPAVRVIRNDHQVINLDRFLDQPRSLSQNKELFQLDSFIRYIEHFKPEKDAHSKYGQSVVFVSLNRTKLSVDCVLDYHKSYSEPTLNNHCVELSCIKDDSFSIWISSDNEWMSQRKMLDLLKQHHKAIADDGFAKLLTSIENVKGNTDFNSVQTNNSSQSSSITRFETLNEFTFLFRPYCSINKTYSRKADLYVQINDGKVQFKYTIRNPMAIYEHVANDLRIKFSELENVLVF